MEEIEKMQVAEIVMQYNAMKKIVDKLEKLPYKTVSNKIDKTIKQFNQLSLNATLTLNDCYTFVENVESAIENSILPETTEIEQLLHNFQTDIKNIEEKKKNIKTVSKDPQDNKAI